MTRAQLSALMGGWLDDPNEGYFTPAIKNTWLNLAQRTVQGKLLAAGQNWYEKPVETLTVANQSDYVLPSDCRVIHRVEVVISGSGTTENRQPIKPITTNQQDLIGLQVGTPTNYYIKKNRITLLPTPSRQWTLRLYYSPLVSDMTQDSDSPDVPEQFMELVAIIATLDGFLKDDRAPENLLIKRDQYEKVFEQMAIARTQDEPRMVVVTEDYDLGGMY